MISRSCVKVKVKDQGRHVEKRDIFYFILCIDVIKRPKVNRSRSKVTRGQGQRFGSKVKVTINVKETADRLMPMSSCFI